MDTYDSFKKQLDVIAAYSEKGYTDAKREYEDIQKLIEKEKEAIDQAGEKQKRLTRLQHEKHFENQIKELENFEKQKLAEMEKTLKNLHEQSSKFTIVVYGRTMAGKSTLMEILTHGDGNSIGKGSQRTTRDVREYIWNDLKVVDVPGTCSYDGKEDDKLAFEAAKSADMILFLLTDDAPQASEGDSLAQIKKLGKPVLGVLNVKQTLCPDPHSPRRKLQLKQLEKKMNDTETMNAIVKQFKEFGVKNGQSFDDIPFIATHLQAAFLADPQRENDTGLYEKSRFHFITDEIIKKVHEEGSFMRSHKFYDSISTVMQQATHELYAQSGKSLEQGAVYSNQVDQLNDWSEGFRKDVQHRIEQFFSIRRNKIEAQIKIFAGSLYEDQDIGEKWASYIQRLRLSEDAQRLLRKFGDESTEELKKLNDEWVQELKFHASLSVNSSIKASTIRDYKSALQSAAKLLMNAKPQSQTWSKGTKAAGIALAVASLAAKSEEDQVKEAEERLISEMTKDAENILSTLRMNLTKAVESNIFDKQIGDFREQLSKRVDSLIQLAYMQERIADICQQKYCAMNKNILEQLFILKHYTDVELKHVSVARLVGNKIVLFCSDASHIPETLQQDVAEVLQEKLQIFPISMENYGMKMKSVLVTDLNIHPYRIQYIDTPGYDRFMSLVMNDKDTISDDSLFIVEQLFNCPVTEKRQNHGIIRMKPESIPFYSICYHEPVLRMPNRYGENIGYSEGQMPLLQQVYHDNDQDVRLTESDF